MFKPTTTGVVATLFALQASATVLTFNDLPTFPDAGSPTGVTGAYFDDASILTDATYQGFRFANEGARRWYWNPNQDQPGGSYNGVGGSTWIGVANPNPGAVAADNFAPAITSATDFVFDGASFAGFEVVRYILSLNGAEVFTSAGCGPLTGVSTFCASGYSGLVDKVVIESPNTGFFGVFFAMDNFTVNTPSAVPEPGSLALVAGALALAGLTRQRQRAR